MSSQLLIDTLTARRHLASVVVLLATSCSNPERCFDPACLGGGGSGGSPSPTTVGGSGGLGGTGGVPPLAGVCGDGDVEEAPGFPCDGDNHDGTTCESLGLRPGELVCNGDCKLGAGFCGGTCIGNGVDDVEVCDGGTNLCSDLIPGATGSAICGAYCIDFDTSACELGVASCGNLTVEAPEQCDGPTTTTCINLGFSGGTLGCHTNCTFDTQACHRCGDEVIHPGEQCDGVDLGPTTCEGLKYGPGGTLACNLDCTFDTAACLPCGNGVLNLGEDCDGTDFGGLTCSDLGYSQGALSCDDTCVRSTSGCS